MADFNPFLTEDDMIEDEIEVERISHSKESTPESIPEAKGITCDQVAAKLLKERLILSALELHTELLESGRELPRLRDFFSNPANFERTKPSDLTSPGLRKRACFAIFIMKMHGVARYTDVITPHSNVTTLYLSRSMTAVKRSTPCQALVAHRFLLA